GYERHRPHTWLETIGGIAYSRNGVADEQLLRSHVPLYRRLSTDSRHLHFVRVPSLCPGCANFCGVCRRLLADHEQSFYDPRKGRVADHSTSKTLLSSSGTLLLPQSTLHESVPAEKNGNPTSGRLLKDLPELPQKN